MASVNKLIGLSLGADICWPACFEHLVAGLDLQLPIGEDEVTFEVERVMVEPFDLQQPTRYDVVIDRLTHWFHTSREWIKKAILLDHLYVLNNPWAIQSMEKQTTYCAMMRLGLPVPPTWMIPPKEQVDYADVKPTLQKYGKLFDLGEVGEALGYPVYMKPYDGGAWVGVSRAESAEQLWKGYNESGQRIMHVQKAIEPYDLFVRAIGIGPQVEIVRYDPTAPLHARYTVDFHFLDAAEWRLMTDMTLTINGFFQWEFNSCEALRKDGVLHPIDFANACPDFQVTSLHYHFPNMVKNMVRWALFCAGTGRKMQPTLDWEPYFEVQRRDLPYEERIAAYAAITRARFQADEFREFCDAHLQGLDELAWEFFGTDTAKNIVRQKVAALYPAHEVEKFTEHFFGLIRFWRKTEADRLNLQGAP